MRVGPGGGCLGLCRVNVQSKDVLECDDKGSFCVIPSTKEGEYVPPVVCEPNGGVSVIKQDPVREWVPAAMALVPLCTTSNLWG